MDLIWKRTAQGVLVEVEHVKALHSKKVKQAMTQFRTLVTENNANGMANDGALLDGGEMVEIRASTVGRKFTWHWCMQVAFTVEWRMGTIVKRLFPKPEEKWIFVDRKVELKSNAWSGVRPQHDRVKVDKKDLDEHKDDWPLWRRLLETSKEARRWKRRRRSAEAEQLRLATLGPGTAS